MESLVLLPDVVDVLTGSGELARILQALAEAVA
jgi:hypothetical protein